MSLKPGFHRMVYIMAMTAFYTFAGAAVIGAVTITVLIVYQDLFM